MAIQSKSGLCKPCGKQSKVERNGRNHVLHLILSIFTAGIWLVMWLLLSVTGEHWRCSECGSKELSKVK